MCMKHLDNRMDVLTHNVLQVNKAKSEVVDTGSCVQMILLWLQKQYIEKQNMWTESIVDETSNTHKWNVEDVQR